MVIFRQRGFIVSAQDVAVPTSLFSHDEQGRPVIRFYVQLQEGFISLSTIQQSVMV